MWTVALSTLSSVWLQGYWGGISYSPHSPTIPPTTPSLPKTETRYTSFVTPVGHKTRLLFAVLSFIVSLAAIVCYTRLPHTLPVCFRQGYNPRSRSRPRDLKAVCLAIPAGVKTLRSGRIVSDLHSASLPPAACLLKPGDFHSIGAGFRQKLYLTPSLLVFV